MSEIDTATHLVVSYHCIGESCKRYYQKCKIMKEMPDGKRYKLLVFGDRYWTNTAHISRVRYVDKNRVVEI